MRLRLRLDEHALAGAVREAGVACRICSAVLVPPAAVSACFSILVPATAPSAIATTQKASQAETAVFQ